MAYLAPNGYIITNNHVIAEGNKVVIIFSNGERVDAKLLGKDTYADISVLSVPKDKVIKVAQIGSTKNLKLGNTVFAIGAPISTDYSGTVTKGIISGTDRFITISATGNSSDDWLMRVIQTDAAINPGNSGGPLLNLAGEVIGINSLKLVEEDVEGIGFAIPIEDAIQYVERLEKGEVIARPMLGVQLLDLDETYALFYSNINVDKSVKAGAVVQDIIADSGASKAGIKKGDIITKIGDKTIDNKAELRYELYKYNIGDKIKITYYRDKKNKEVEITLTESKE
jgi:serine protease Do